MPAAISQDLGITEVFSGDAHFQQVGLGFRLLP
jgi:predicted nucleic acid-binding protein